MPVGTERQSDTIIPFNLSDVHVSCLFRCCLPQARHSAMVVLRKLVSFIYINGNIVAETFISAHMLFTFEDLSGDLILLS